MIRGWTCACLCGKSVSLLGDVDHLQDTNRNHKDTEHGVKKKKTESERFLVVSGSR